MAESINSFDSKSTLQVGEKSYDYFALDAVPGMEKLPYSLKVLGENLLRNEDGKNITREHIEAIANWDPSAEPNFEIQFTPARVIMQDFTGVACIVDLATIRDAVVALGGDADDVNPLNPAEMVIDHSVIIEAFGDSDALEKNVEIEYQRNDERYKFLRWGTGAFENFRVVPPGTGIVHQVNIEYLARSVFDNNGLAYPDTCVGTDSHTTMENGLGILGWGVGGIEAEAAMLGQPISMLIPRVVGFKLTGEIPTGVTATDVVLTITDMLRQHGVVGKFVEFYGKGVGELPLANRATIGNMSPEFGSTAAMFPIDEETVKYLELTGRDQETLERVEAYAKAQGMWLDPEKEVEYSEYLELDLSTVVPSIAGPKRPQDRIELNDSKAQFRKDLHNYVEADASAVTPDFDAEGPATENTSAQTAGTPASAADAKGNIPSAAAGAEGRPSNPVTVNYNGEDIELDHGMVAIASITSCTNTSNPSVMVGAGLLARNAAAKGLKSAPWVKTSMAPGSQVVNGYYEKAGLWKDLEAMGFYLVGYGCTTCIGNSGPLPEEISAGINEGDLAATAVLSGNRNFEGRINPDVKMNYLASPILVIAYAIAGTMDFDFETQPLGQDQDGNDVFLKDIWPSTEDIEEVIASSITKDLYAEDYANVFEGDERWRSLDVPSGKTFDWDPKSTYIRKAPYFDGMSKEPEAVNDVKGARVLALLGDSVTTDHISPASTIKPGTPAAQYLDANGVERKDYNSLGARRGNHEVMVRGTFANIRLQNQLLDGVSGGYTRDFTQEGGPQSFIYDAAMNYQKENTPLVVLGGKEYGTGSSRDWAAKGTLLLGVKAVIAESFERIHRSNLIGMGVVPLQFPEGESWKSLGIEGTETFDIEGIEELNNGSTPKTVKVTATKENGEKIEFDAVTRIDTPGEADYYRNGGILQFVLRNMMSGK
ncbi:aconitase [Corynebacterium jeikeium K411]|uniref:Aconitate hydratase A n=1 Tax=Corynebacterium jeikeium (strain K411) TaxID=306537 RepID=ACNA_CORJK|nr:aconitate hydratase AcnA [Corynebacterium jeikeium]Q4JVM4.1 RecName: Full=Aconitate hydratase A; Short=ACN; Short=Aconitase; AltName: Full=(2R,3S)-2-methylisocitrate dehydratase; AltName: Full=(2S,3R)-3-hydroxybutane-1,2,3-tricarboxylate dehydratase; AltName: Full=Iron-responsive protein-like; Short=IRP-like; AltName: Full=Probable 2-methyl-cis-aconitate hydratase; AltName: Full=RNA-binding protein [Corynebacterium jeikeium K411]CAI37133.1 aconitase [Corynebacterium jeikeium K411]